VSRLATAVVLALLAGSLLCAQARADADPASDVLLAADVFYPYSPPIAPRLQAALNAEVAAAHRAHFPIKVAIIATPTDLGAIPELFDKPRQYAAFLDQEISFGSKVPLLVVMPDGYGIAGISSGAAGVVAALGRPASTRGDGLTQTATVAVPRLAAAAGHPLGSVGSGSTAGSDGLGTPVEVAILAAVCVGLAAGILAFRRRRAPPQVRRG
jgi:hypothetical protein